MEAELQPYQFLQTDDNKEAFALTNDKTTSSYVSCVGDGWLALTRPIGRDHRLILNISKINIMLQFTTCGTASLLANDKHIRDSCGASLRSRQQVTDAKRIKAGTTQAIIRRTTDNRIEAVLSDASGGLSTEFWDLLVAADVPVVPEILTCQKRPIHILPDEAGLQIVRSQIEALQAKHVLTAIQVGAHWNDLRSVVQSTASKVDPQILDQQLRCREKKMLSLQEMVFAVLDQQDQLVRSRASVVTQMESLIQYQSERMQLGIKSDIEQLILSVRTELSSLKSEQSADHDHKTQSLERKIREQSERIGELVDQMEQMKVGSHPVACHGSHFSSWISNDFVAVRDSGVQRIGEIDQKNYVFRSTPFGIDEMIMFTIRKTSEHFMESMTFGVTGNSFNELVLQSLPENGLKLQKSSAGHKWHVAYDCVPHDSMKELIGLKRTEKGIVMRTASTETLLLVVDPFIRIFPFFLFDGSVEEIELKEFKV